MPPEVVVASQRRRLLDAMTELAATKGLADLTVSDLTAHAGVSRKSFYALFRDKTDCYIAGFAPNSRLLFGLVRDAMRSAVDPRTGILDGYRTYLRVLEANPVHARAYLLESMRGGPDVLAERDSVQREYIELTIEALERAGIDRPRNVIVALVGGINELVCRALDQRGTSGGIAGLEPDVTDLVVSVLHLSDVGTTTEIPT